MTEKADEDMSFSLLVLIFPSFLETKDIWGQKGDRGWEYTDMDTRQPGVSKTFFLQNIPPVACITPRNVGDSQNF